MVTKINKGKKKINKKGKMVKRQVSIITVFLWVFLVTTMITITTSSIRKNNSIVEIDDENWNVSLVIYDRSSDTPDEAITDFTWNAENKDERKELVMQINYNCTTGKQYNPGELIIEVDGFGKNGSEGNKSYYPSVTLAADKVTDKTKKYDWSYNYDSKNNIYVFTNNGTIADNEHFEGTIQIVYNLEPRFKTKTDLGFKAKFKENVTNVEEIIAKESNVCNFHYTSNKNTYYLYSEAEAAPKKDYTKIEDILDDYYWVKYEYYAAENLNIIMALDENGKVIEYKQDNKCIKTTLPEGAVIYDNGLKKIEPKENNTYYYLNSSRHIIYSENYYYIGYPKSKYNVGDSVTNVVELWGRYEDEEDMQKITERSSTVNLVAFDFEYKGELYQLLKSSRSEPYVSKIKNDKLKMRWFLDFDVFYTDSKMDVEIGDDLLYITRKNGEETKLEDDEYNFTEIKIPVFYTYNKYSGSSGDKLIGYNYEVQVRCKDTNEYVVYSEGVTADTSKSVEFDREDIVGVKILIKDLDKTLYSPYSQYNSYNIAVDTNIYTNDCKDVGYIFNYDYLQVYKKDEEGNRILANEITEDSYSTQSTKLKIAEYDMNTYGRYIQRAYASKKLMSGFFEIKENSNIVSKNNNVIEEKYEIEYNVENWLYLVCYEVNKDCIIKQYNILPLGMNLASSREEIVESIISTLPYENLKLKDGTVFNSNEELKKYIKENTTVEIEYNYRDSGRIKISIIYNLNEIDWSYYLINTFTQKSVGASIKVEIPYDSILEYGKSYACYVYAMWNNQEYSYNVMNERDNGRFDILARDIDNDGDTNEKVAYAPDGVSITHAVSSQQAVIKQVRTDLTKGRFVEGTAEASAGSEYTYKLRVTTGANSLKDLILYDDLETTYNEAGEEITEGWKGEFLNVNTEYAVSKGYAPKVYYSEEKNPGKLTEVPDKWKELTDEVDKSTVKSICVDLRYKADGSEMELSPNNVVFVLVNMKVPNDDTLLTSSHNMFRTNWRAIDPLGDVIDNIEGIYSNEVNVEIHKEDIRTEISGTKTWEDENNKYGVRPESITVKLLQDGQEYEEKQVTEDTNWNYTFENVPVYASNTREYEYKIVEEEVQNYETTYDGYNITNSIKLKDIEVIKIWDDNNNESGKRPDSVTLQVYDGDILISEAEVNEENNWKHTFTNLLKYRDNGSEIEYRIDEKSFPNDKFYTKGIVENKITNTFTVPDDKIDFIIFKNWVDNRNEAGKRPSYIDIYVKNSKGKDVTNVVLSGNRENSTWGRACMLPKYDELGNEEYYYVEEESTIEFYENSNGSHNNIYNTFKVPDIKKRIDITKIWDDNNNEAGKRPESIKLQVKDGEKVVQELKINTKSYSSKITFEVPKYDKLGNEVTYTVDEEYTNEFYTKEIVGNTITNKFTMPEDKIKIVGTKVWEDNEDFAKKRPKGVILQVIANSEVITEHEVSESSNWSYEFEVPKYDRYGNEIEYHIDERDTKNKFYKKELTDELTVTNRFEVPSDKKSIEVMKVWDDNENEAQKRPTSIKLQIKRNGTVVEETEVNESTSWKHTFELPKYDERGDEIEYTVDEDYNSEFYIKSIVGYVITNTFVVPEDRVKITGTKVWKDNGNTGGKRDDRIFLQLKNERDEVISEAEVSDKNNWSYEFEVAKYDSLGNIVKYHIDERNTKNKFYAKELTDDNTVTNKFIVPDEKVLVKAVKVWDDKNNSADKRPNSVTLQIYNKDVLVVEKKVSEADNWNFEVELPKYDELGDEIVYTVDEKEASKYYEKEVAGLTVTNRLIYELPNTSDINVFMYIVIFFIAIIGIIVGVIIIKKNKKK